MVYRKPTTCEYIFRKRDKHKTNIKNVSYLNRAIAY